MANYEYTINIKRAEIKDGQVNRVEEVTSEESSVSPVAKPKEQGKESKWQSLANSVVVAEGKRYAMLALSNVGRYTGNSLLQARINNTIEAVGLGVVAVTNPALALTSATFSVVQTTINETFRRKEEQVSLASARLRNGYTDAKSITTSRRH